MSLQYDSRRFVISSGPGNLNQHQSKRHKHGGLPSAFKISHCVRNDSLRLMRTTPYHCGHSGTRFLPLVEMTTFQERRSRVISSRAINLNQHQSKRHKHGGLPSAFKISHCVRNDSLRLMQTNSYHCGHSGTRFLPLVEMTIFDQSTLTPVISSAARNLSFFQPRLVFPS